MTPNPRGLDSNVNWDKESQRKFWNEWDIQHLQTISEETLRRGNEVLSILSSLNLRQEARCRVPPASFKAATFWKCAYRTIPLTLW
jgi:hypothetical protein